MSNGDDRGTRWSLATLSVRLVLGVLFVMAGIGKFAGGYSVYVGWMTGQFQDSFLPGFLLLPYTYALPFGEILLGVLLLAGLFTPWTLFATLLLLTSLIFGMLVHKDPATAAHNAIWAGLAILGLLASEHDRFSLDHFRKKTRPSRKE